MQHVLGFLGSMMLGVAAWVANAGIGAAFLVFFGVLFIYIALAMFFLAIAGNQVKVHQASMLAIRKMLDGKPD